MTYFPLISIIIPVYNGENYVKEAIDSALNQTYKNIEIVVVNDGSKDNTDEILQSYDDKIRYIKKENGGVASALNLAIKESKGEYISWLSHDDLYVENKIEKQVEKLKTLENKNSIIFSNSILFYPDDREIFCNVRNSGYISDNKESIITLLFSSGLHGCSLLIPKAAFEKCGYFDENLRTTQDYDLWFKFIKHGYPFVLVDEYLVKGRQHEMQDTRAKVDLCFCERQKLFINASKMFLFDLFFMKKDSFKIVKKTLADLKLKHYYRFFKFIRIIAGRMQ